MTKKKMLGRDYFWQKSQALEEAKRLQKMGKPTRVVFDGKDWIVINYAEISPATH
jgi:hypothetical protein